MMVGAEAMSITGVGGVGEVGGWMCGGGCVCMCVGEER